MQPGRNRWVLALAAALLVPLAYSEAAQAAPVAAAAAVSDGAPDATAAKISEAARALEQAALQAQFASDARELALLQQAHDDLSAALDHLHGTRRTRTMWLLDDLEQAIQRSTTQLGPVTSPVEDSLGPRVPSRDQLAQLAIEAQELERQAPDVHRLVGTAIIGATQPREDTGAPHAPPRSPIDVANRELLSWPLGNDTTWP
jgi:hypothetical protein